MTLRLPSPGEQQSRAEGQLPLQGAFAGRMDLSQVRLPDNALYHLYGPVPFMHEIRSALIKLGIPSRDIQYVAIGRICGRQITNSPRSVSCGAERPASRTHT